jgi:hypothetical protein
MDEDSSPDFSLNSIVDHKPFFFFSRGATNFDVLIITVFKEQASWDNKSHHYQNRDINRKLLSERGLQRFKYVNNSMKQSRPWEANSRSDSRNCQPSVEPECSLPCSQKPAIGPYPETTESNPIQTFPRSLCKIHFNVLASSPRSSKYSLPSGFPTKIVIHFCQLT